MLTRKYTRTIIFVASLTGALLSPITVQSVDAKPRVKAHVELTHSLPRSAVRLSIGGSHYYQHKGTYYKKNKKGYRVVPAPKGIRIHRLPRGYSRRIIGGVIYYHFNNVYYRKAANGYVVVDLPIVAQQTNESSPLEDGYQTVWFDQKKFLYKDGQFFQESPEGLVWVESPIGAVVKDLPYDAISIWHEEIEYFESDNTLYRKTPDGYKVVEKPWTESPND